MTHKGQVLKLTQTAEPQLESKAPICLHIVLYIRHRNLTSSHCVAISKHYHSKGHTHGPVGHLMASLSTHWSGCKRYKETAGEGLFTTTMEANVAVGGSGRGRVRTRERVKRGRFLIHCQSWLGWTENPAQFERPFTFVSVIRTFRLECRHVTKLSWFSAPFRTHKLYCLHQSLCDTYCTQ